MDWKSVVGSVAPLLGTALGGPLGGAAARLLSEKFLGFGDAPEADISAILANPTPDDLRAIKEVEQQFQALMREMDIKEEDLFLQDRSSARKREVEAGDSTTPRILAGLVTVAFFAVVGFLAFEPVPVANTEAVYMLLGTLAGGWTAVIGYYFGSSAGSAVKNRLLKAK